MLVCALRVNYKLSVIIVNNAYLRHLPAVLLTVPQTSFNVCSCIWITICPSMLLLLRACSPLPIAKLSLTSPSPFTRSISYEKEKDVSLVNVLKHGTFLPLYFVAIHINLHLNLLLTMFNCTLTAHCTFCSRQFILHIFQP